MAASYFQRSVSKDSRAQSYQRPAALNTLLLIHVVTTTGTAEKVPQFSPGGRVCSSIFRRYIPCGGNLIYSSKTVTLFLSRWRTAVCDILDLGTYCTCTSARVSSIMHGTLLLSSGSVVDRVFPCHIALYAGDHIALGCAATT
jgi:hypothetical protein